MLEAFFLATAKAAPAATAAASAGEDWKWQVPVATLILGFGLKWFQDFVTERHRRGHERALRREQRFDQLRARRVDAERANLLELQPLVVNFVQAATNAYKLKMRSFAQGHGAASYLTCSEYQHEGSRKAMAEVDDAVRRSSAAIIPLQARLHSVEVRVALNDLIDVVWAAMDAKSSAEMRKAWDQVDLPHNNLHGVMGRTIKQLEDENQQLGDPPVR
ncbi:MAG: hypothetical protein ACN6RJ_08280 [Stenotrophomonas sp.]